SVFFLHLSSLLSLFFFLLFTLVPSTLLPHNHILHLHLTMAPIPRLAAKPLSIITGALFTAFSAPSSTPPTNGANATLPDTQYIGSASFLNLTLFHTPPPSSSSSHSSSSSSSSPISSLVYYHSNNNTYTGCNKMPFSSTDNVVLMNPLQFGNATSSNSTCGDWIQIQNRQNTDLSTYAQIVGVCDD
ncbi:MAG: hypothetical protein JOS17DRAFT_34621, partial [Linnemannia elongata]